MITQSSIDEVRESAAIEKVVGSYVKLNKRGANFTGCCPFHDEKTPSFHVSVSKGIFKCFGCGTGGDAIAFIMKQDRLEFIEAVRKVAEICNITLEEKEETEEDKQIRDKRSEYLKINAAAAEMYSKNFQQLLIIDPVKQEVMNNRQLTYETIQEFQIGYAPEEWKFITAPLIDKGLFVPAKELGLVTSSNDRNFDFFRNRVMFPIYNEQGAVVGFGGRIIGENPDNMAKYINSKETMIYKKEKVLFGLYQALKWIKKYKYAILVEGYFDVVSMHQSGARNTVATCGTALTEHHAKLLKKHTDHVVLFRDNDKAGLDANLKDVNLLIRHNLKVDICLLPNPEEEGKKIDPDIFAREHPMLPELIIE